MKKIIPLLACACVLLAPGCASTTRRDRISSPAAGVTAAFTKPDRTAITRYYRATRSRDIDDQPRFQTGEILPAYAARNILPEKLEVRLTCLPPGFIRVKAGNSLFILDKQSSLIADSFDL